MKRANASSLRKDLEYLASRGDVEYVIETISFDSWPAASLLAVLTAIARHAPSKDAAAFRDKVKSTVAQVRAGELLREVAQLLELPEDDVSNVVNKLEDAKAKQAKGGAA